MDINLQTPLDAVQDVYAKAATNGTRLRGGNKEIPAHFRKLFNTREKIQKIPALNVHNAKSLKNRSLVRFRCMIQDTSLSQEVYVSSVKKENDFICRMYTDGDEHDEQTIAQPSNVDFDSRQALYCVSIPGDTSVEEDISLDKLSLDSPSDAINKRYPFRGESHTAAIVKMYDYDEDKLKVTDTIEVIGVLEHIVQATPDPDAIAVTPLPPVPTIHTIFYDPIPMTSGSISQLDPAVRDDAIKFIASALDGDLLAAEFVLLQCLSKIISRRGGMLLGNMSLNLSRLPLEDVPLREEQPLRHQNTIAKKLSHILNQLMQKYHDLPLTLSVLNGIPFYPKNDETLDSGVLQLSKGTMLLVDETAMQEGKLVDMGVRNIQVLNEVISTQKLNYIFPFSQYEFDTEISFIVLSNAKSFLQVAFEVPLEPVDSERLISKGDVETLKNYIANGQASTCEISEEISKHIQQQFVTERKEKTGDQVPSQDDLARRIGLARLVAISFGKSTLDKETWDHAVKLDLARLARVAKYPVRASS